MTTIDHPLRTRLEAGELTLGIGLRLVRSIEIAPLMASAGFDFLFIDREHGLISEDLAGQICIAAQAAGISPIVRVPGFEAHHASRALDAGALGIVFPHVDDADTAARLASHCRYPPEGTRSIAGNLPQLGFRPMPIGDATRTINQAIQVVVMVETVEAVRQVHAIAAAPGVDVVLVGTNDLSIDLGIPGQLDHPDLIRALEEVLRACREHGKVAGLGGIYQIELMRRCIDMGFRWITTGSDLILLYDGARTLCETARSIDRAGG
ncbi:MAG: aldolase/citrate lyase family protein [Geminicoccaceae bacterium]|nr:aldolase/citrate lyase family protein [Geminicoccaceae bacterium]